MFLTVITTGCGYHPPGRPTAFPVTSIAGKVRFAGKPIEHGWVTLVPMHGTLGDPMTIPLRIDGRFASDIVPVGDMAVRVTIPRSAIQEVETFNPALARLFRNFSRPASPLRVRTKPQSTNRFEVDLAQSASADKTS